MGIKQRSFTMIELMVVISIILILTAVTIYSLGPARAKSRDSRRIVDANLIMNAVNQYYTSNLRTYPTRNLPDVTDTRYYAVVVNNSSFLANSAIVSNYLGGQLPTDPINNSGYRYVYIYRGDGKKAAVVVDKLESMTNKCNTGGANVPDAVKAYLTGDNLAPGSLGENPNACYFVAS